jgi:hypothetical protein
VIYVLNVDLPEGIEPLGAVVVYLQDGGVRANVLHKPGISVEDVADKARTLLLQEHGRRDLVAQGSVS